MKIIKKAWIAGIIFLANPQVQASDPQPDSFHLDIVWVKEGTVQPIKSWSLKELSQLKKIGSIEKDPITQKLVNWQGVSLSNLIEKTLLGLSSENRAQIDLVILKNQGGTFATIPRFLFKRYPLLLAFPTSEFENRGLLYSVVPWSSKPSILKEVLPLDQYFIPNISRIELANDEEINHSYFLKRRTDPSAIRGEKLFVQSCSLCHQPEQKRDFDSNRIIQSAMAGSLEKKPVLTVESLNNKKLTLKEKDRQSILNYLNAYQAQNLVLSQPEKASP